MLTESTYLLGFDWLLYQLQKVLFFDKSVPNPTETDDEDDPDVLSIIDSDESESEPHSQGGGGMKFATQVSPLLNY